MGECKKYSEAFHKNGDEIVVYACHGNADTTLLEHTVISDRKKIRTATASTEIIG
jgi:hypothetical protein